MTTRICLPILILSAPSARAGNYWLSVADDRVSACAQRVRAPAGVVASSKEVAADVTRHFRGEKPQLGLFTAAFGNARVTFCGTAEREAVYAALIAAALQPRVANEQHLFDYSLMLGNDRLLAMVDTQLSATNPEDAVRRLRGMRDAATTGIDFRSQRGRRTTR